AGMVAVKIAATAREETSPEPAVSEAKRRRECKTPSTSLRIAYLPARASSGGKASGGKHTPRRGGLQAFRGGQGGLSARRPHATRQCLTGERRTSKSEGFSRVAC